MEKLHSKTNGFWGGNTVSQMSSLLILDKLAKMSPNPLKVLGHVDRSKHANQEWRPSALAGRRSVERVTLHWLGGSRRQPVDAQWRSPT